MAIVKVVKAVFVLLISVHHLTSWTFLVEDVDVYKNTFHLYNIVKNQIITNNMVVCLAGILTKRNKDRPER